MSNNTKTVVNGIATFTSKENTPPNITITADDGTVSSISRIFQRQSSQCAVYDRILASPSTGVGPRLEIDNSVPVTQTESTSYVTALSGSAATLVGYLVLEEGAYYETIDRELGKTLGHYSLNDASASSTAADSTGRNAGIYSGTVTKGLASLLATNGGTSVDFGNTGFVNLSNPNDWDVIHENDTFTVSIWVNYVDNTAVQCAIGNATDPGDTGFSILFDSPGGQISAGISNGTTRDVVTTALPANGVYHLIFTGNGGTLELYVNGSSVGTAGYTPGVGPASGELNIAGVLSGSFLWEDIIDEVTLSSSFCTSATASALYNAGI